MRLAACVCSRPVLPTGHARADSAAHRSRRAFFRARRADRPRSRHQDHRRRRQRSRPQARRRRDDHRAQEFYRRRAGLAGACRRAQRGRFRPRPADQHGWLGRPARAVDPRLRPQSGQTHRTADRAVGRAALHRRGRALPDRSRHEPQAARRGDRSARRRLHPARRARPSGAHPATNSARAGASPALTHRTDLCVQSIIGAAARSRRTPARPCIAIRWLRCLGHSSGSAGP